MDLKLIHIVLICQLYFNKIAFSVPSLPRVGWNFPLCHPSPLHRTSGSCMNAWCLLREGCYNTEHLEQSTALSSLVSPYLLEILSNSLPSRASPVPGGWAPLSVNTSPPRTLLRNSDLIFLPARGKFSSPVSSQRCAG